MRLDERQEFRERRCPLQFNGEMCVAEHMGDFGGKLQLDQRLIGRRQNEKHDVRRLSVGRIEIETHSRQAHGNHRLLQTGNAGMRHGNTVAQAGRQGIFP